MLLVFKRGDQTGDINLKINSFYNYICKIMRLEEIIQKWAYIKKRRLWKVNESYIYHTFNYLKSYIFSSVTQLSPTLCDPMVCGMPGFPVHHQLPELAQTHVHPVSDAIQPSYPLLDYLLESLIVIKLLYRLRVIVKNCSFCRKLRIHL